MKNAKVILGIFIGILIGGIVGIKASELIESSQVIYKDNNTVATALDELFSAVDINERLGDTDISGIGDGTVTGALNSINGVLTKNQAKSGVIVSNHPNGTIALNYIKSNGTTANIGFSISGITTAITSSTVIATVPEEFWPPFQSFIMGYCVKDSTYYPMVFSINNDGRILQHTYSSVAAGAIHIFGTYPLAVK